MFGVWKPIETAPKVGKVLLDIEGEVAFGGYCYDYGNKNPRPYWVTNLTEKNGVKWSRDNPPRRWMELPET